MKSIIYGLAAAGFVLSVASLPAQAQLSQEEQSKAVDACTNGTGGKTKAIDGCTALINNLEMSPSVEVTLRYLRGSYLVEMKKYEVALQDLDRVVAIYDTAADKANWRAEAVEKVAWTYPWRGEAHEALKKCEEAAADYNKASEMAREITEREKYKKAAKNVCRY